MSRLIGDHNQAIRDIERDYHRSLDKQERDFDERLALYVDEIKEQSQYSTCPQKWVVWNETIKHFEPSLESAKAFALAYMDKHFGGCEVVQSHNNGDIFRFYSTDDIGSYPKVNVERICIFEGKEVTVSHYKYLTR